jgi:hypothetical protein
MTMNRPTVDDLTMALGMETFEKLKALSQLTKAVAEVERLSEEVGRLTKLCEASLPPAPEGP